MAVAEPCVKVAVPLLKLMEIGPFDVPPKTRSAPDRIETVSEGGTTVSTEIALLLTTLRLPAASV